ncbi:MAG: c-type cytochrome [Planctomycetes bacterium]|nr:c-type cytochrome [Planctomycetota bacterium]
MGGKGISYLFIWVVSAIAAVVLLLKVIFPLIFMLLLGKPGLMITPRTLFTWYMIMAVLAGLLYATSSGVRFKDFLSFLYQGTESSIRNGLFIGILVIVPLIVGYITYGAVAPGSTSPVELRIQHPTLPGAFEHLENPYRKADAETQKQALMEGKTLYYKNCQPCHGDAGRGDGPLARGLRLKPIDFTDPGTIATVVEAFVFWRVKEGYAALPSASTPWDSAMPVWKDDLSDDEIWKIITALYEITGISPRMPEAHSGEEAKKFERLTPSFSPTDGKGIYEHRCAFCHGFEGDGNGPVADYLHPRPRDFTKGLFKLRTTGTGELPLGENIFQVITWGMPGTSMAAWDMLREQERSSLVSYVKTFAEDFALIKEEELVKVEIGTPPQLGTESLPKGRELYVKMKCIECHGENGRGNGPAAGTHIDDWGQSILPTNLTDGWKFIRGNNIKDVYATFSTGLNGTPMPSYIDTLTTEERWALAHYVSSLSVNSAIDSVVIESEFAKSELPDKPDDPQWESVTPIAVPLIPQAIIRPRWQNFSVSNVFVKSIYNDKEIAFLLEWGDRTKSVTHRESDATAWDSETDSFIKVDFNKLNALKLRDAVAIKFPVKISEGPERPHFIMGDASKSINLWQWKADWQEEGKASPVEELNAKGLTKPPAAQDGASQATHGFGFYDDGRWRVVIKRPLVTTDNKDVQFMQGKLIPIAFSVWDGSNGEVGNRMSISSWYYLILSTPANILVYMYSIVAVGMVGGLEWVFIVKNVFGKVND